MNFLVPYFMLLVSATSHYGPVDVPATFDIDCLIGVELGDVLHFEGAIETSERARGFDLSHVDEFEASVSSYFEARGVEVGYIHKWDNVYEGDVSEGSVFLKYSHRFE